MIKSIMYVHGDNAHIDEVLACALVILARLLGYGEFSIVRLARGSAIPKLEEGDFVLDVGMEHDGLQRFDHHQHREDVKGECAASLVNKFLKVDLSTYAKQFLERVTLQDVSGRGAVGISLGGMHVNGPLAIESGLVRIFEDDPETIALLVADTLALSAGEITVNKEYVADMLRGAFLASPGETQPVTELAEALSPLLTSRGSDLGDAFKLVDGIYTDDDISLSYLMYGCAVLWKRGDTRIVPIMNLIVNQKIKFLSEKKKARAWVEEHMNISEVNGIVIMEMNSLPPDTLDSAAVNAAKAALYSTLKIDVAVGPDSQGEEGDWVLFRTRTGEEKGIDFSKSTPENLVFAHKGGFLLKFKPKTHTEWVALLAQATTS